MLFFFLFLNSQLHSQLLDFFGNFLASQNFFGNIYMAFIMQITLAFEMPWIWQTSVSSKVSSCHVWPEVGAARPLTLRQLLRNPCSAGGSGCSCGLSSGWGQLKARGCDLVLSLCPTKGMRTLAWPGDQTLRDTAGAEESVGRPQTQGIRAQCFLHSFSKAQAWVVILLLHHDKFT